MKEILLVGTYECNKCGTLDGPKVYTVPSPVGEGVLFRCRRCGLPVRSISILPKKEYRAEYS